MARSRKSSKKAGNGKSQAFENVKNQLAYCGLWCGSCLVGNGTVNERAQKCRKAIIDYGVHEWGPSEVDYKALLKGLAVVGAMTPCRGCLKGGGRTDCEIRACAVSKRVSECVDCKESKGCTNVKIISHMRRGAKRVGMKVKNRAGDRSKVLREWQDEATGSRD